ncbi:hypothetical protein D3C71_1826990 [compost metagenome]
MADEVIALKPAGFGIHNGHSLLLVFTDDRSDIIPDQFSDAPIQYNKQVALYDLKRGFN